VRCEGKFFVDTSLMKNTDMVFGDITATLGTIAWFSGPPRTTGISFTVNY